MNKIDEAVKRLRDAPAEQVIIAASDRDNLVLITADDRDLILAEIEALRAREKRVLRWR